VRSNTFERTPTFTGSTVWEMFKSYGTFVGLVYAGYGAALQTKFYAILIGLTAFRNPEDP
jgi:hypothetical protein